MTKKSDLLPLAKAEYSRLKDIMLQSYRTPLKIAKILSKVKNPQTNSKDYHVRSEIAIVDTISKKISNDQELIQSDPTSCPQNQKGNN